MSKKQTYQVNKNPAPNAHALEHLVNTAMALHQRGNFIQAEQLYRQLLQSHPKHAYALNLLGVLISQHRNEHAEAEKLIARAIAIDPDVADYHNNLGLARLQQGKYAEAVESFRRATRINPGFLHAWFGLGNAGVRIPDANMAIEAYQKAISIAPDFFPAYNNLGNVYRELRQFDKAMELFHKVLEIKPDFAEAWYNIGVLYKVKQDGEKAVAAFDQALQLKPDYLKALSKRGNCHLLLNDVTAALSDFDAVLAKDPCYIPVYIYKANAYRQAGRFDDSENALRKALAINELSLDAYLGLVSVGKYKEHDFEKLRSLLAEADLATRQLIPLHFTLGKIYDERGEYDKAFRHLLKGNELHRGTYKYDHQTSQEMVTSLIRDFNKDTIEENRQYGLDSELPVFIVGMPRSGTTLVEQIIGSHPEVYAAGELKFIGQSLFAFEENGKSLGDLLACPPERREKEIRRIAGDYLDYLRKFSKDAKRLTDKMPHNFLYAGMIAIMFPGARIIHCQRNPLDTCFSIYEQIFDYGHHYAYDLAELGRYYREYRRLMAHWEYVLPGKMLQVRYEDILNDQEGMSRQLIEFIGLPWDERCLKFHETERSVKTISQWQVRQKLYTTSKERWRHYEPWLGPLVEALGDVK